MKRNFLLVLMALAFAINAPELSYSQTNLEVELLIYGAALDKSSRDLNELMKDLTKITKKATHGEGKSKLPLTFTVTSINMVRTICQYESRLLSHLPFIEKDRKRLHFSLEKLSLQQSKKDAEVMLDSIRNYYGRLDNIAALHLVDKATATIRQSIGDMDNCIKILATLGQETEEKKPDTKDEEKQ